MRIMDYNVREVQGKERPITRLTKCTDILRLSETWFKRDEIDHTTHVSVAINHKASNKNIHNFKGAALMTAIIKKYTIIRIRAHPKYKFKTIGLMSLTAEICYISPSATAGTRGKAVLHIQRYAGTERSQ